MKKLIFIEYILLNLVAPLVGKVAYASVVIPEYIPVDMGLIGVMVGSILGALALMWGLRKTIKTINRS